MSFHLTIIGLGRMGANIARRIREHAGNGISLAVFDINEETTSALAAEGFQPLASLAELSQFNDAASPQVVWIMVPASVAKSTIHEVADFLDSGSVVIDGGNSFYRDDIANAQWLFEQGIAFVDVGTSGGIYGLERGYSLMIGGESDVVARLSPIFEALAPGTSAAARTLGRSSAPTSAERGFFHCGPAGAGHFVKMVHNGIEYGAMAALAEGLNLLHQVRHGIEHPTFVGDRNHTQYDLNIGEITEVWRRGSVISSWLLDLTAEAFADDGDLTKFRGTVADSGEGRWTLQTAIDARVPATVLAAALMDRFTSQGEATFAHQVLSAMRSKFGGHLERQTS